MASVFKICSRGHRFQRTSDCPVCPICWHRDAQKKNRPDFLQGLSAPAIRALEGAKIKTVAQLAQRTEKQILALHGMGPVSLPPLRAALRKQKRAFKKEE